MADRSLIESLIGGAESEVLSGGEGISAGPDPAAAAAAIDAARADPTLSAEAADYFRKQARLVDIQTEHLHEQRAVQISHLKLRRFSDRLRAATQVFFILAATVAGLGLLIMLNDAFTSKSVVIEAFKAPSVLAGRGLTGDVVASGVLDQLQKLQAATHSASKALNTKSAWSSDIKVEVPQTGVSIGEIDRLLHARFGHDVHVGGDLVQTETGALALTVRGDGVPAKTFEGAAAALDALTTQAAEYIYGRSQPYQFATYLDHNGRDTDALAFLPGAVARAANDDERAQLLNVWGNAYLNSNRPAQAAEKYRLAMAVKPGNWKAWGNLVSAVEGAQGEEAAWREAHALLAAAAKAPKQDRPELRLLLNVAGVTVDLPLQLAANLEDASRNGGAGTASSIDGPGIADDYALMHDPASAARAMASSDPDDPTTKAEALLLQAYDALGRGVAPAAVPPLEAFWKAWQADANMQNTYYDNPCFLGLAYGLTGRMAQAEAVFKRTGPWSRCVAMHGDALEHAGDLAGAERVWAEGIRIGPDLSPVYLHRGVSELNRGETARAGADLAAASARSPHWADPLKAWGDVLARQGRWKEALTKYDAALKYAPAWAALHEARGAAAKRQS